MNKKNYVNEYFILQFKNLTVVKTYDKFTKLRQF